MVSGATGTWVSSLDDRVIVQPSGVFVVAGDAETTFPSSTGRAAAGDSDEAGAAATASGAPGSGSAPAGAAITNVVNTMVATAALRTITA